MPAPSILPLCENSDRSSAVQNMLSVEKGFRSCWLSPSPHPSPGGRGSNGMPQVAPQRPSPGGRGSNGMPQVAPQRPSPGGRGSNSLSQVSPYTPSLGKPRCAVGATACLRFRHIHPHWGNPVARWEQQPVSGFAIYTLIWETPLRGGSNSLSQVSPYTPSPAGRGVG